MNTTAEYQAYARQLAGEVGIPVNGFLALISQESGWNANAVSGAGAKGLCQFMPATWAEWGNGSPFDAEASMNAGALYLVWIRDWLANQSVPNGWDTTLAAYNWGIGNVRNAYRDRGSDWLAGAPAETREYVGKLVGAFEGRGIGTPEAAGSVLLLAFGVVLFAVLS